MKIIDDKTGKVYGEINPTTSRSRGVRNLADTVSELQRAIVDLQNRVSTLDQQALQWPADTYEPSHAPPFEPDSE